MKLHLHLWSERVAGWCGWTASVPSVERVEATFGLWPGRRQELLAFLGSRATPAPKCHAKLVASSAATCMEVEVTGELLEPLLVENALWRLGAE